MFFKMYDLKDCSTLFVTCMQIATDTFISITYLMMDAMAPVTILSQFFQTENVDVAFVKVHFKIKSQWGYFRFI